MLFRNSSHNIIREFGARRHTCREALQFRTVVRSFLGNSFLDNGEGAKVEHIFEECSLPRITKSYLLALGTVYE